jgi:ribosome-associated toxin RatA of RatAB toxin-antitoxin module
MNYNSAAAIYRKNNLEDKLTGDYFNRTARELVSAFEQSGIQCRVVC